jgi:hypothetical protein
MADSKYNTFLESYNKGINQFQDTVSESFFTRINPDKTFIISATGPNSVLSGKFAQIDDLEKNNQMDSYSKLKLTGNILQDVVGPLVISNTNPEVKKSGANILNSFFDVAKETEDVDLLKIAANISNTVTASNASNASKEPA